RNWGAAGCRDFRFAGRVIADDAEWLCGWDAPNKILRRSCCVAEPVLWPIRRLPYWKVAARAGVQGPAASEPRLGCMGDGEAAPAQYCVPAAAGRGRDGKVEVPRYPDDSA